MHSLPASWLNSAIWENLSGNSFLQILKYNLLMCVLRYGRMYTKKCSKTSYLLGPQSMTLSTAFTERQHIYLLTPPAPRTPNSHS